VRRDVIGQRTILSSLRHAGGTGRADRARRCSGCRR